MHCFQGPVHIPYSRRSVQVQCSKGFGGPAKRPGKPGSKGTAKTADQAADQALAAATKHKRHVRPIDPREAARGKVDYVQVKDWAKGEAADIGELEAVPGSYNAAAYTAAEAGVEGSAAAGGPFYQQLAHHAQYLESQGALNVALEPGAKPFLPFESWQYSLGRYRQYMADLAAVHLALEQALHLALAAPPQQMKHNNVISEAEHSSSSSCSAQAVQQAVQQQPWAVHGRTAAAQQAYSALACFSAESGLWRAHAAQADVAGLAELAALRQQQHAAKHHKPPQQQQQQQQGNSGTLEVHASQNAVAYGKYLLQLGRSAAAATAAAASASSSGALHTCSPLLLEEEEGTADVLKLIAHAYALHVQQQCLGTRIGAAATDQLALMSSGVTATSVYMEYPAPVKEPLQQFITVTNNAGRNLDGAGRQSVMVELPKALRKATLMLAALATA